MSELDKKILWNLYTKNILPFSLNVTKKCFFWYSYQRCFPISISIPKSKYESSFPISIFIPNINLYSQYQSVFTISICIPNIKLYSKYQSLFPTSNLNFDFKFIPKSHISNLIPKISNLILKIKLVLNI